jgi:1-acyl-sn-glycerol-3-phosphate acyltransferase
VKSLLHATYSLWAWTMAFVVLFVICTPLVMLAPTLRLRRAIGRAGARICLAACLIPFRRHGYAQLPDGPSVLVCNHASYIDGVLLSAALPVRFTFLIQSRAANWPVIGMVLRRLGARFVDRQAARAAAQATLDLIDRLRAGESFFIFPEGPFRAEPGLLRFYDGAFVIAARAGVPVVPCVLRGARTLFPYGQARFRWTPIEIDFLAPITPTGLDRPAAQRLRDASRAVILARCGEMDVARHPSPD